MTFPATAMQATHIPNGSFRFTTPSGEIIRYQIYTVRTGRWAGRRVLKFHSEEENTFRNNFAAFAFLNVNGTYALWSRFENRSDTFILFAGDFLRMLTDAAPITPGTTFYTFSMELLVESLNCCSCNEETEASDHFCREHWPFQVEEVISVQPQAEPSNLPRCEVTGEHVQ